MSNQLQKADQVKDIRAFLTTDAFQSQLALALPKHMTPDRFARVALTAMTKNPKLLDCTRDTLLRCLMDCSSLGLEPNGRDAHLIPRRNNRLNITECTLIVDWKGLVALARRSGDVALFWPQIVRERDSFEWENGRVTHRVNWREERGEAQAVYSYVKFKDGSEDWEVLTLEEVEAVRKSSQSGGSGPWVTHFDEMAKKTAIRRHSKRLTLSPEFMDALDKDDDRLEERQAKGREVPPVGLSSMLAAPKAQDALPAPDSFALDAVPPSQLVIEWLDAKELGTDDYLKALDGLKLSSAKEWRDVSEGEHQTALNRAEEVEQFIEEARA